MIANNRIRRTKLASIGIVSFYAGKLPWYFDFFLHSCKYNLTIDFFVITDNVYLKPIPNNVKIIYMTMQDLSALATEKMGFANYIEDPYKINDYKPAFGLLFSDILNQYDFWGFSDIDVIYGNIRLFFENSLLKKYDFMTVRHDYTAGCFSLFKNNETMNNIFKKSRDYKKIFLSNRHFCFDECNFAHRLLTEGHSILDVKTEVESFTHVIKEAEKKKEINAYFDFLLIEGVPGHIKFDQGRVIYKNRFEAVLYHLIKLKQVFKPKLMPKKIAGKFRISSAKIY